MGLPHTHQRLPRVCRRLSQRLACVRPSLWAVAEEVVGRSRQGLAVTSFGDVGDHAFGRHGRYSRGAQGVLKGTHRVLKGYSRDTRPARKVSCRACPCSRFLWRSLPPLPLSYPPSPSIAFPFSRLVPPSCFLPLPLLLPVSLLSHPFWPLPLFSRENSQ